MAVLQTNTVILVQAGDLWSISFQCIYCDTPAHTEKFSEERLRKYRELRVWFQYSCACQAWTRALIRQLPEVFTPQANVIIETYPPVESL